MIEVFSAPPRFHERRNGRKIKETRQYSEELAIFRNYHRFGPRRVTWCRHDAHSITVVSDSHASNTRTAKSSRLPTNLTAKERAEKFCAISQSRAVLPQKKRQNELHKFFLKKAQQSQKTIKKSCTTVLPQPASFLLISLQLAYAWLPYFAITQQVFSRF